MLPLFLKNLLPILHLWSVYLAEILIEAAKNGVAWVAVWCKQSINSLYYVQLWQNTMRPPKLGAYCDVTQIFEHEEMELYFVIRIRIPNCKFVDMILKVMSMPSKLEQHLANCSYVDSLFSLRAAKIHINCSKEAYA